MKVGWLVSDPGYIGGAELTQAEFRDAAPQGIEVVGPLPPGQVVPGLDRYVLHNLSGYSMDDMRAIGSARMTKYVHDLWPAGDPDVRTHVLNRARLIFCSPLQVDRFRFPLGSEPVTIPPAVDKATFRPARQLRRNGNRSGVCSIAGWRNPGKGGQHILEYAEEHGPVDVYGGGEFIPFGPNLNTVGELDPEGVAQAMWNYAEMVFLPTELEPFCRTVAEAHFAGLKVTTNGLVGATHWLENDPAAIDTAARDFWEVVLEG